VVRRASARDAVWQFDGYYSVCMLTQCRPEDAKRLLEHARRDVQTRYRHDEQLANGA